MNPERDLNSGPLRLLEDALAGLPHDAGRLAAARTALRGIAAAADDAVRPRLSRLAAALDGLLELVETQTEDEQGSGGSEILDFVRDNIGPLRTAVCDEPHADESLDAALAVVETRWGEYLSLMGGAAAPAAENDVWSAALSAADSDPWSADDLSHAQTREGIDRILGSLAAGAGPAGKTKVAGRKPAGGKRKAEGGKPTNASVSQLSTLNAQLFGETDRRVGREPPPPVAVELDDELLQAYLDDATAGVGRLEQLLLAVESVPHDGSLHRQICRELHTLKGASASVGLTDLAAYLHAVEDDVDAANGAAVEIAPMLNCVDAVRRQIATLSGQSGMGPAQDSGDRTSEVGGRRPASIQDSFRPPISDLRPPAEESLRVKASRVDRLMDLLAELVILRNQRDSRLSRLKNLHSELTRCVTRLRVLSDGIDCGLRGVGPTLDGCVGPHASRGPARGQSPHDDAGPGSTGGQSGSVVEIASDVAEMARTLRELAEPMEAENVTISQFTRQFRMELIEMRRMPVSGLFQRLNRAARDAARTEGRRIDFQLQGEHAGLDRSLQERLYEPLLHMVRNAVSHGIESPEDRRKAGKPETGTITLSAKGSPTTLVIEVSDDGRGLDYEAIRRKALDKGLIAVGEAVEESRLARLIFHPGFSTRQETNAISGRGVGMDVVAAALQRMRAKIDVESRAGQGTTMRLTIPLRSVIEHAMVVRVWGRLYALPMQFVQAARPLTASARSDRLQPVEEGAGPAEAGHYERGGIRLRTLLGDDKSPPPEREYLLLLGSGRLSFSAAASRRDPWDLEKSQGSDRDRAGGMVLIVDDVVGPEEVVVRSLPSLLKSHPILGGVTLSGAGEIVQLLDGQRLLDFAADLAAKRRDVPSDRFQPVDARSDRLQPVEQAAGPAEAGHYERRREPGGSARRRVLVVDDSLSARRRLAQLLKNMGFEVTEAGDGLEGIDRLRNGQFQFVFTDLEMPRLDGFGFLGEVQRLSPVPVAVVSSRSETEFRDRAQELGAAGYLVKPATEPALAELVAELETQVAACGLAEGTVHG